MTMNHIQGKDKSDTSMYCSEPPFRAQKNFIAFAIKCSIHNMCP